MENIKKNFGFGCMRFPMNGENVDIEQTKRIFCYGSHAFPGIPGRTAGKVKGFPAAP